MADAKMLNKVPVREQDPKVRATNFEEVCLGYNQEEAMEEAQFRCHYFLRIRSCRQSIFCISYARIFFP